MKNKKGFTIIEVLITIVIIGVLALIATPLVVNYLNEGKEKYNESIKNELRQMAENYFNDHPNELPKGQNITDNNGNINGMKIISKVTLNELEKDNYVLNDLVDADKNECSESYVVVELANGKYQYHSCLKCGNNDYTTDDNFCEFTLSGNDIVDNGERSCEIVYDVPESNWINYDLNLTMKATSDFDVIRFVDDNNKVITPEKVGNLYTGNYMISKTGSYNIYAIDKTGTKFRCNESAIAINIDKEKPTCGTTTGAGSTQNWVNTDRTITQYCNDAGGSNCKEKSYVRKFTDDAQTATITISDNAGNKEICTVGVYIDKTPPSCSLTSTEKWATSQTLTITSTDTDLNSNPYSFTSSTSGFGTTNIKNSITKAKEYKAYIKDKVGNVGSCSYTVQTQTQYRYRNCSSCGSCSSAGCKEYYWDYGYTGGGCTCLTATGRTEYYNCSNEGERIEQFSSCSSFCKYYGFNEGGSGSGCSRYTYDLSSCRIYKSSCQACGCSSWGSWSSWSNNYVSSSSDVNVETRTVYK